MEFPYRKSGYIHVDSLHMYSFILKTAYSANDCYNKEQTFLLKQKLIWKILFPCRYLSCARNQTDARMTFDLTTSYLLGTHLYLYEFAERFVVYSDTYLYTCTLIIALVYITISCIRLCLVWVILWILNNIVFCKD